MGDAMRAGTVTIESGGDQIEAYLAQPLEGGPFGGVVVVHHLPGYDEAHKEITRHFAANGLLAICPNLYSRQSPGASPDEAAAAAMEAGGIPDEQLVTDVAGAAAHLRSLGTSNGKVGVIGYCSGGRQAFLAACSLPLDAAVDCYGAFVTVAPPPEVPLDVTPVVGMAPDLSCPLLGIFGAEDQTPSPEQTADLEKALIEAGKTFEFHTFEGAGHAFFAVNRPNYRPEAAAEAWPIVDGFLARHLAA